MNKISPMSEKSAPRLTLASIQVLIDQLTVDDKEQPIKSLRNQEQCWRIKLIAYSATHPGHWAYLIGKINARTYEDAENFLLNSEKFRKVYLNSGFFIPKSNYCSICDTTSDTAHNHDANEVIGITDENFIQVIKREIILGRLYVKRCHDCDGCRYEHW